MSPFPQLDPELEKTISKISVEIAHDTYNSPEKLVPIEARIEQIKDEIRINCLRFQALYSDGMKYCIEKLRELAKGDFTCNVEDILNKFENGSRSLQENLNADASIPMQSLMEIDDTTCVFLYKAAATLLTDKEYEKARASFFFLTTLNQYWATAWLCLGHAEFFLENYRHAASCYHTAYELDNTTVMPLIQEAECHEKLDDFQKALDIAVMAKEEQFKKTNPDKESEELINQLISIYRNKNMRNV